MNPCTQPGCTGSIADGYCDLCGMAAASGTTAAAATSSPAAPGVSPSPVVSPTASGPAGVGAGRCTQPGCAGAIVDGYCDVCGSPATAGGTPLSADPGSVRTSSFRIDSAPLGSTRAGTTATGATRRVRSGSTRTRVARLGAGLTTVPPAAVIDPSTVVKTNPEVPENKRNCSKCDAAVGRSQEDRPGRPEGFCPSCGTAYSFTPKLQAGDLVAGQYLVAGALAHGGLGWIYLARDRNVSDRWVVLKGLLNSGDQDALAAAIAEQRFLAQVEHPLIVEIYNFVTHDSAGYIVMEYVGGSSLKDVLKSRTAAGGGTYTPLPPDQALAYIIEVLPAFQYLHDLGLIYCDFKPDNLIQVGDAIKLIDLGGVRQVDDNDSAIYGTIGYQAPEVATAGPSVASDIYTIGRTLLVLTMEFRGYQSTYRDAIPPPEEVPFAEKLGPLYWLIAKCCAPDPADRFVSADELRMQALGVLREVVAQATEGTALTSAASVHFTSPAVSTSVVEWSQLPELKPDPSDPQYPWLVSLPAGDPDVRLAALASAPQDSAEVWLARGMEQLRVPNLPGVDQASQEMLRADPWEWRALWLSGLAALRSAAWPQAQAAFNAVYKQVPGELAPKLALAVACEQGGQGEVAESLYQMCASTDAAYVAPAAFGIARLRAARGDAVGAVAALDLVPSTSRGFNEARRLRASVLLENSANSLGVLDQSLRSLDGVRMDTIDRETFTASVLERALEVVRSGAPGGAAAVGQVGPFNATEKDLRVALEGRYRAIAAESPDRAVAIQMIDRANAVRVWSLT